MSDESLFLTLSNPISPEVDGEFNRWYGNEHSSDMLSLPHMRSITRYRLKIPVRPADGSFDYKYLALYRSDNAQATLAALVEARSRFTTSETLAPDAITMIYDKFFYRES